MLPSEVDSEDVLALGGTQWDVILIHCSDLSDLYVVAELISMAIKLSYCSRHVLKLDKELRLNLVTIGTGRLVRQEVVYFLIPHAKARLNARVRAASWDRMSLLNELASIERLRANSTIVAIVTEDREIATLHDMLSANPD